MGVSASRPGSYPQIRTRVSQRAVSGAATRNAIDRAALLAQYGIDCVRAILALLLLIATNFLMKDGFCGMSRNSRSNSIGPVTLVSKESPMNIRSLDAVIPAGWLTPTVHTT